MLAGIRRAHGGADRWAGNPTDRRDAEPAGHSVVLGLTRRPRRRCQRRVGETAWTESSRKMADRIRQGATGVGQRKKRRTSHGWSRGGTRATKGAPGHE